MGSSSFSPQFYQESSIDLEADFSTGYLEDVLLQEFRSKRRRLLMLDTSIQQQQQQNCWVSSDLVQNCCQDFDTLTHVTHCDRITEMKTPEEGITTSETMYESASSSQKESAEDMNDSQWTPEKGNLYCIDDPIFSSSGSGVEEKRKKRISMGKVVYPFALVKPGGFEGDVATLNDINERILMPPTRPVRHPVGDYACRPLVSPEGPGLSGKTVVAFTRVHTQGRGTITIIRTRG